MKHISIIVPSGNSIVDTIIAPYNMFKMANSHYKRINNLEEHPFKIDLLGLSKEPVLYQGLFSVTPTTTIDEVEHTDLIIVAAISGNLEKEIENNAGYIPWIRKQRIEHDTEIASLCKGAFLLAETGIFTNELCHGGDIFCMYDVVVAEMLPDLPLEQFPDIFF